MCVFCLYLLNLRTCRVTANVLLWLWPPDQPHWPTGHSVLLLMFLFSSFWDLTRSLLGQSTRHMFADDPDLPEAQLSLKRPIVLHMTYVRRMVLRQNRITENAAFWIALFTWAIPDAETLVQLWLNVHVHYRKFATGWCIVRPPNTVYVATLPCKILNHNFTDVLHIY